MQTWRRREPERSALYQIVWEHLDDFLTETAVPAFVAQALRAYLDCGIPAKGFLRLRCDQYGDESLVAFSCKDRSSCPCCTARRAAETAAHLVDAVLPMTTTTSASVSLIRSRERAVSHADSHRPPVPGHSAGAATYSPPWAGRPHSRESRTRASAARIFFFLSAKQHGLFPRGPSQNSNSGDRENTASRVFRQSSRGYAEAPLTLDRGGE